MQVKLTNSITYLINHRTVCRTATLKRKLSPLHATFAVFVACPPASPRWQPQQTTVGLPSIPALLPLPLPLYLFLLSLSLAFFLSCPRRRQSPIAHNDYVLGGRSVGLAESKEMAQKQPPSRGGRERVLSPLLSKLVNVMNRAETDSAMESAPEYVLGILRFRFQIRLFALRSRYQQLSRLQCWNRLQEWSWLRRLYHTCFDYNPKLVLFQF